YWRRSVMVFKNCLGNNEVHMICFVVGVIVKSFLCFSVQEERKQLIKDMCNDETMSLKDIRHWNFLVDDDHCLIYCYVPKVAACTNLKKFMFVLKHGEPYSDPREIQGDIHLLGNLTHLALHSSSKIEVSMCKRVTFHVCPLYANHTNPPETVEEGNAQGLVPSFENFIQYLVDPRTEKQKPFDTHWRQMHRLCNPCLVDFDLIGHLETMQEDFHHLLKTMKLQDSIMLLPASENVTTTKYLESWFRTVPLEDRRKLYKIYEIDFKLFGYRRPYELLDS
uniref:Carbohydrate sulfotransferase n=1 Tax=Cynoglossus semilaevis TaxID=244447 RepID=A0A3P8WKJ9_CYNSE